VTDVLMAYVIKHGSTRQVAEAVTAAMRRAGARVTALPAREARESAAGYDLVVPGAPLYSGRWHHDAQRFLKRHRRELTAARVTVFGMGPRNDTEDAWAHSRAQLDRALAKRAWLAPMAITIFGGIDPPRRGKRRQRDLRNWQTIHTWATDTRATAIRAGQTAANPVVKLRSADAD